jgi:hypothetical protein
MEEYDEMLQVLEHPEIKEFMEEILEHLEETLEMTENLMGKHHPDLPQPEGIGEKDMEEEPMPGDEDEIPAEEAVEGMEGKHLGNGRKYLSRYHKGIKALCPGCDQEPCECGGEGLKEKRLVRAIGKALGKALTEKEAGEVVDKLEGEMEDTEKKSIKKMVKAVGVILGKDLTDEEAGEVVDKLEGEMEDTEETKSILCKSHKDAITGASGFLEEASNHTGSWEDEHRTKAASWHKALSEIGAEEAPPEEFTEGEGEPGEMGQKGLAVGQSVVVPNATGGGHSYTGKISMIERGSNSREHPGVDMYRVVFDNGRDGLYSEQEIQGKSLPLTEATALQKALDQQQKDLEAFTKTLKKLESAKL